MSPFYKGLHHALTSLYGDSFNLSSDNKIFEKVSAAFESVTKWLHRKKNFQPEMLMEKEPQTLINETFNVLKTPLENLSIEQDIPEELTRTLEENIFHFSGFKTYHELKEASLLLKDEKGGFKSFDKFAQDVKRINERYNINYLNAEYEFAVSSSQMAVKWKDYEKDGDRYNLQYRTAADDRVREEHAALHGITLPPSDKFWDKYYPPNGWRCRCTVVQVRKGKYDESDSDDACKAGEKATTHIGKNGSNKAAIFRFNPGKQEKIFPPKHSYYKVPEAVKEKIDEISEYRVIDTKNGFVRIHKLHGKKEKKENIRIASYFADKYGHEIDLIKIENNDTTPDTFNKTLGINQEYKSNTTGTVSSIDSAIRSGKNQADHIVLEILSDISMSDLSNAINDRVKRSANIQTLTILKDNKDHTYTREEMIADGFKIQSSDLD